MKRSYIFTGALLGFLSSLILMAISYLGNSLAGFPFIPFDLFDWLARHLPGGLIDTNIRTMISIITALHLGPTASTAKLIEQVQSMGLIVIVGVVFGLILGYVRTRRPIDLIQAGLAGGIILWLAMVAVELGRAQPMAGLFEGALWLLVLLGGWGWLLARGLMGRRAVVESRAAPNANQSEAELSAMPVGQSSDRGDQAISRRSWLLVTSGGVVSAIVLLLGLRKFSQVASETSSPSSPIAPPVVSAQGSGAQSGGTTSSAAATPVPANYNTVKNFSYGPDMTSGPAASPSTAILDKRLTPAPSTRAEITPVDQFYRIDINTLPVGVDPATWRFTLKGLVKTPLSLSLGDIQAFPNVTQAVTLECISNPVGGDLISTNFWTGVRLKDVLAKAEPMPSVKEFAMTAADGFYESIPIAEAMDERTLLVFAMNGAALTPEHGFPLRIYIPGHYGMKQPKWLTTMEAIDHEAAGYWVERGWSATAIFKTTSVIDNITVDKTTVGANGMVPLGGIAWAGVRGISKVEVQVNDGPWVAAELRTPTVSPLTWVQWRYDWKPPASGGNFLVQVRATDGAGAVQETQAIDPGPEGATGLYSVQINI